LADEPELRPRQYAQRCVALASKEQRRAYLADVVPEHFQALVRVYVVQAFRQKMR